MMKRVRCAIYTRKSSEEGLDQDFNSLDAQREASEAFVKSQAELGWRVLPQKYDDGGFSGGTLERPALRRLLTAIDERRIDVIVIYKIDRLTRSLTDFARLAERFDACGVSFVSVTQQFNTATSMGRLMLNVLLSFAQFEREITGERIRDKIAASKRKGMWMGGMVPLGYDLADRALSINPREARTVRRLYELYLEIGSITALQKAAKRAGLRTKQRTRPDGTITGNAIFSRGHLHRILNNPLYCGRIVHKNLSYPGLHERIIGQAVWERTKTMLAMNRQGHKRRKTAQHTSLLTGLLFDPSGNRYVPSHTSRHGRRYRYYVLQALTRNGGKFDEKPPRLPADQIEGLVRNGIEKLLTTPSILRKALTMWLPARSLEQLFSRAKKLGPKLSHSSSNHWREHVSGVLKKVIIHPRAVKLHISRAGLMRWLDGTVQTDSTDQADIWVWEVPCELRHRGQQLRIVIDTPDQPLSRKPDATMIKMLRRAQHWREQLESDQAKPMKDLAKINGVNGSYFTRVLRLAYLAPDIIEAIVEGRQPVNLTATILLKMHDMPIDWAHQRRRLRFPPA